MIVRREMVRDTFNEALRRGAADRESARQAAANALCLSLEAVDEALADSEVYDATGPRP